MAASAFDVTLSFDNGPDPDGTPHVLGLLARYGIKATFFVIGEKLAAQRHLTERAHAEGHWIGNHSWDHAEPFGERDDPEYLAEQIGRTQVLIGPLSHPRKFYRPRGAGGGGFMQGTMTPRATAALADGGYTCVGWNSLPGDWKDADAWVENGLEQITSQDWSLVVLHDNKVAAMQNLERFLVAARASGARFRQEFPPSCIPIAEGEVSGSIADYYNGKGH